MNGTRGAGTARQPVRRGDRVWSPPADARDRTRVGAFLDWVEEHRGLRLSGHEELWRWSVTDLEGFWSAVWEFFGIHAHSPYEQVLAGRDMPGARWFTGALLNYAEHALGGPEDAEQPAILARSQTRADIELTFGELRAQVTRFREVLLGLGVGPGDRVAGYLPNVPEAVVAFLATASIGAVWASCACEFGSRSVVDRFAQVEPVVLLVAGGYQYGDKPVDRRAQVDEIRAALPSVRHVIDIEYGEWRVEDALSWPDMMATPAAQQLSFTAVPFGHPLFVLFSSGTTGLPKAIVHGHGGILVEHLKNHAFSWDIGPGDRMLWFTTTAWMMWNALVSTLLLRASIVMVDGNPLHPDLEWQWRLTAETRATIMGASPGFIMACRKAGVRPTYAGDLAALRTVGSAGAPLPPEGYAWIRDELGDGVQLNVGSGGTDVCSGLVQNSPLLPVWAGEISGRCLGVDVHAFDEDGHEVVDGLGELVITSPMPSMPVGFWGDDGSRLRAAYFAHYPGVWRHGDWIEFRADGRCHVAGRSDATLNRGGVRLGTAEFYRVVEELEGVADSLVVHLEDPDGGNGALILFVRLQDGATIHDVRARAAVALRTALSPRHVPDEIVVVPAVPRNLTGKKLELPVKRILQGAPLEQVASRDALAAPDALDYYVEYAADRRSR
ncbi:acetoacetate--CoA ligase [Streptomyces sp. SID8361]|uniref:acetoacetate--CoA ligase n=1 Tax=Streptomyces sp. MnatMP-M27 TaxID=1839768 RepID=UPI00081D7C6E|nr:acetoacetate--CoA ligase [Streptomyces sp. MnatMP-M27]MYU11160.1 acetoacetate--CoA ligase [Streptomyces sp. SID8361]SCF78818.1 acetoacetyl-CoA synthetase [Streptomyces sp. MnatMP-M27]